MENKVRIQVKVKPGSKNEGIREWTEDGSLVVAVGARPMEGKANQRLIELLASHLKIPKRDISIVSGKSSRKKIVEIQGISLNELKLRPQSSGKI